MSSHRYISCFVCHMDGGSDGLEWDFTQRGEGLRRTTSLQGRAGTGMGPAYWSANFDEIQDFEHDIRELFGGRGFMADTDFGAGTRNTAPGSTPAAPALVAGPLPAGDHLTPQGFLVHDVGTLKPYSGLRLNDTLMGFDTPTLKGIWEFGPYLHDGSAGTLMDVITVANPDDKHGKTSHLTLRERERLVAYLMQIDDRESEGTALRPRAGGRAATGGALRLPGRSGLRFARPETGPGGPDWRDARGRQKK